jgi:hypothetical protein
LYHSRLRAATPAGRWCGSCIDRRLWGGCTGGAKEVERCFGKEDANDEIFEVCCEFLGERFPGNGLDGYGAECAECENEEEGGYDCEYEQFNAECDGSGGYFFNNTDDGGARSVERDCGYFGNHSGDEHFSEDGGWAG